jgi:bacillithiol biosynthesis deacetylase BshB1
MSLDLLAFGPHPDDIEIGIGGTVARHTSLGLRVGLCDVTAGEMGSNGTPEERMAEAAASRAVLGAVWRENLGWPDRRIGSDQKHIDQAAAFIRRHRPHVVALPHWGDRHPDHRAASEVLTEAVFNAGLRRYPAEGEVWKVDWICYYFVNDGQPPSFVVDVSEHYERKQEALDCFVSQFEAARPNRVQTRLNAPLFRQLIQSRDAQLGALAGVRWAEGFVVREPVVRPTLLKSL